MNKNKLSWTSHFFCRFTEKLWTRSAGKGGSHWRHDSAALPTSRGSSCSWGKWPMGPQLGQSEVLCGPKWSKRAWVWHSYCLDPFAKDNEEIVKEITWKRELSLVYFVVDTKLLRGSLSRICILDFGDLRWHRWHPLCPQSVTLDAVIRTLGPGSTWALIGKATWKRAQGRRSAPSDKSHWCLYFVFLYLWNKRSEHLLCCRHCAGMTDIKSDVSHRSPSQWESRIWSHSGFCSLHVF